MKRDFRRLGDPARTPPVPPTDAKPTKITLRELFDRIFGERYDAGVEERVVMCEDDITVLARKLQQLTATVNAHIEGHQ